MLVFQGGHNRSIGERLRFNVHQPSTGDRKVLLPDDHLAIVRQHLPTLRLGIYSCTAYYFVRNV